MAVSKKSYTGITDVPAKSLICKHKCSSCVDASDCQEVLRVPSFAATLISMPHSVGCVTRCDASDCHKVQVFILVPQLYKSSHQDLQGRAVARYDEVIGRIASESILFQISISGVHLPSKGRDSKEISLGENC